MPPQTIRYDANGNKIPDNAPVVRYDADGNKVTGPPAGRDRNASVIGPQVGPAKELTVPISRDRLEPFGPDPSTVLARSGPALAGILGAAVAPESIPLAMLAAGGAAGGSSLALGNTPKQAAIDAAQNAAPELTRYIPFLPMLKGIAKRVGGFAARVPSEEAAPMLERGLMPATRNNTAALEQEAFDTPRVTQQVKMADTGLFDRFGKPIQSPHATTVTGPSELAPTALAHSNMVKRGANVPVQAHSAVGAALGMATHPRIPSELAQVLFNIGSQNQAGIAQAMRAALLAKIQGGQ